MKIANFFYGVSLRALAKYSLILLLLCGGCCSDLYTKRWAETALKGRGRVTVVEGLLELGFVQNRGMVFGVMNSAEPSLFKRFFAVVRIVILLIVSLFIVRHRNRSILFLLPFLFIAAGAWGNVIDHIQSGHVVDFIHISLKPWFDWPFFFNLADAYLCVGMALALIYSVVQSVRERRQRGNNSAAKAADSPL
jgi:signal peptidase II